MSKRLPEKLSLTAVKIILLACIYCVVGRLGLLLAIPPGYATVFWPASGLALAVVYIYGYRLLPGVLLGSAALNYLVGVVHGHLALPVLFLSALLIGMGSTFQAGAGVWLIDRFVGRDTKLERLEQILRFILLAGPAACLIAASCGTFTLAATGSIDPRNVFFTWWTWYTGDTLGVIVFSPLLVLLFDARVTARRKLATAVPMFFLFMTLISFFVHMRGWIYDRQREAFQHDASLIARDLEYGFRSCLREIQAFAAFYDSSEKVEKEEFISFVRQAFRHTPGMSALNWVPRIPDAQRAAYIKEMRRANLRTFEIRDLGADKKLRASPRRTEYFPLQYAEPAALSTPYIGMDMSSEPVRREALEKARDSGAPVATNRIHFLNEKDPNTYGFLVFIPIYKKNAAKTTVTERRAALMGFVMGAFRFNDIVDPFAQSWREEGIETVLLNHSSAPPGSEILYRSRSASLESYAETYNKQLSVFGRIWEVRVGKLQNYAIANVEWAIWTALGMGVLFIAFAGIFLLHITGRTAEVEQIVGERTDDLRRALDRADAASLAKSEFLANMSHEIRTPMTGIVGMTQLLVKTGLEGLQKHYAAAIASSADALLLIIDDILDISKIEARKVSLENIPFSFRQLCRDVFSLLDPQAQQKKIGFYLDYSPECPEFFIGDPTRIRQILFNLCSNALKFTAVGEVRIDVTAEKVNDEGAAVRVSVIDTGIGIPLEKQKKIFEKFDQADTSTTRKYGGTGLGLSISRNLARMMGSSIVVQSEPGVGSIFSFTLILPRADGAVFDNQGESQGVLYHDVSVLLAEDIPINQEVIATMLRDHGLRVDIVSDGSSALAKIGNNNYDLIFLDCQMPEIDGYEVARRVRGYNKAVPIIAMTAHALKGDRERCLQAGMNDYMPKPIRDENLDVMLAKWLPAAKKEKTGRPKTVLENPAFAYKHLQVDALSAFRSVVRDRFPQMATLFIDNAEGLLATLRRESLAGRREEAMRAAHSLKSASGQLGASILQVMAADLEKAVAHAPLEQLVPMVERLYKEFAAVRDELRMASAAEA